MQKSLALSFSLVLFAGAFAAGARAAELPKALTFVPASAKAVVVIDVKQVADSEAFKAFQKRPAGERFQSDASKIKDKAGIDVLADISRITLFGKADRSEAGGMILEGRFDEAKLVARLQANPQYGSFKDGGLTIHQWSDQGERYGCFPAPGLIAVWNSRSALDESLAAREDAGRQFMSNGDVQKVVQMQRLFGDEAAPFRPAVWAAAVPRQDGGVVAQLGVKAAFATLARQGKQVLMQAWLGSQSPASAVQLRDVIQGWVAFGQMQESRSLLSELARNTTVTVDRDQVRVETRYDQARVSELIDMPRPERRRAGGKEPASAQ